MVIQPYIDCNIQPCLPAKMAINKNQYVLELMILILKVFFPIESRIHIKIMARWSFHEKQIILNNLINTFNPISIYLLALNSYFLKKIYDCCRLMINYIDF